jgi:BTB/POZ domain
MPYVVHFKVEGQYFNLPRSILELHPDSLLHLMSNEQLNSDYYKAVDVEGDSVRFRFVLDFLRDHGFVFLPKHVTMEAFLAELLRFNILNLRTDKILRVLTSTGQTQEEINQHINDEINSWNIEIAIVALAMECATLYHQSKGDLKITVPLDPPQPACSKKVWNELHSLVCVGEEGISHRVCEGCTEYLKKFDLKMVSIAIHPTSKVFEVEMEQTKKESEPVTTNFT